MELIEQMTAVVEFIRKEILHRKGSTGDVHWEVCNTTADQFGLWDLEEGFPIWLSRIVQGEMADLDVEL